MLCLAWIAVFRNAFKGTILQPRFHQYVIADGPQPVAPYSSVTKLSQRPGARGLEGGLKEQLSDPIPDMP